jgi:hypothetical protein
MGWIAFFLMLWHRLAVSRKSSRMTEEQRCFVQLSPAFCYSWEVVQLAVHQILDLIILVRVQASQPNPSTSHRSENLSELFGDGCVSLYAFAL